MTIRSLLEYAGALEPSSTTPLYVAGQAVDFPQRHSPVGDRVLTAVGVAAGAALVSGLLWRAARRWERR